MIFSRRLLIAGGWFIAAHSAVLHGAPPPALPPPPPPPVLPTPRPAAPAGAPWKVLFDGSKVTGLRGMQKPDFLKAGWKIVGGALVLTKEVKDSGKITGGDLVTTDSFVDFEFSFEFKLAVSSDSGVLYFARSAAGGKPVGHEFQIIDDVRNPEGLRGGPIKQTGALLGIIAPVEGKRFSDAGQWNEGRLVVQGAHVEHWLNGARVLEYDLGTAAWMKAVRDSGTKPPPGLGQKVRSPIILRDEGEEIAFRNLKVRPLSPK